MTLPMENEAPRSLPAAKSAGEMAAGEIGPGDLGVRRPGKAAGAFRTISEVANDLDVPQHVLRFWETRFTQIRPLKRAGGRRYYRPEDVELLRRIRELLYNNGYTIKGVQRLLREPGRPDTDVAEETPAEPPAPEEIRPPVRTVAVAREPRPQQKEIEAALHELLEVRELLRRTRR